MAGTKLCRIKLVILIHYIFGAIFGISSFNLVYIYASKLWLIFIHVPIGYYINISVCVVKFKLKSNWFGFGRIKL